MNIGSRKDIRNRFKDLKLKYKLAWIYAISGFLPVSIILTATYIQMKEILRDKEMKTVHSYLYQALASVENEIEIYNNLSNYISFNQSLSQVLSYDYSSTYELYTKFVTIMDPMLSTLQYFHDEVNRVTVYVDNGAVKHGDTLALLSEIEDTEWYQEVKQDNKIHWFVDKEKNIAFSASNMAMLKRHGITGILYISVDYNSLFKPYEQAILNNYGVYIMDQHKNEVYKHSVFDKTNENYALNFQDFRKKLEEKNSDYKIISSISDTTGWQVYLYKPVKLMVSSMKPITVIAVLGALVCAMATVTCVLIMSKFVTKRITYLQRNMIEVEKGNLQMAVQNDSRDEIGDLILGFNVMLQKLNVLINEVYQSKIKEKEYEMRAL